MDNQLFKNELTDGFNPYGSDSLETKPIPPPMPEIDIIIEEKVDKRGDVEEIVVVEVIEPAFNKKRVRKKNVTYFIQRFIGRFR